MSPRFAFRPEAREELREAVLFYEKERPGLGAEFAAEVRTILEALVLNPHTGPEFEAGTRRKLVPRFPYSVLYLLLNDRIEVIALMHHRREPRYWLDRM